MRCFFFFYGSGLNMQFSDVTYFSFVKWTCLINVGNVMQAWRNKGNLIIEVIVSMHFWRSFLSDGSDWSFSLPFYSMLGRKVLTEGFVASYNLFLQPLHLCVQ